MRVARRDTYGTETESGVLIRRRIFAGSAIPDHLEVDASDYEDLDAEVADETADTAEKPTRRRSGKTSQAEAEKDE